MSLHRLARAALLIAFSLQLCACAASNAALRSQPAGFFSVKDYPVTLGELKGKVTLRCAKVAGTKYKDSSQPSQAGDSSQVPSNLECDSVSADLSGLSDVKQDDHDTAKEVINLLVAISDFNCSNFLNRAFSTRSALDFTSKLVADLAAGASAGTASVAPAVSAGMSGLNLVVGKTDAEYASIYYADKTFDALEKAIAAERTKRMTDIISRRDGDDYLVTTALSDSRYYDDACSIRAGLESLNAAAEKESSNQQDAQKEVTISGANAADGNARSMAMQKTLLKIKQRSPIVMPPDPKP